MDIQAIFAARLKRERIREGRTMADFSREVGISLSSLEEYEGGRRIPRVDTLELIAKRLGIPLAELLMEDGVSDAAAGMYLDRLSLQVGSLEEPARRIGEDALNLLRDAFHLSEKLRAEEGGGEPEKGRQDRYCYTVLTLEEPWRRQKTYGLLAKERFDERWINVAVVAPFSDDRKKVLQIAEKCSALQLSPVHILDVVMDCMKEDPLPERPEGRQVLDGRSEQAELIHAAPPAGGGNDAAHGAEQAPAAALVLKQRP